MGIANKLNSGRRETMPENINTKELTFIKAAELAKLNPPYPLPVLGYFINTKGDYGASVTLAVKSGNDVIGVNLPSRYVEQFKDLTDDEVVTSVLVEKYVTSPEGCFLKIIDECLLLKCQAVEAFHLISEHLYVGKSLIVILKLCVLLLVVA